MKELKLKLATTLSPRPTLEPFRIVAEGFAEIGNGELDAEGKALADLLYENLPGGTIEAMIEQLRLRYSARSSQVLNNPFLVEVPEDFDEGREDFHSDGYSDEGREDFHSDG